jgi:hypothetical protein
MNYLDLINGLFEAVGAGAVIGSILKLNKQKKVRGIHWGTSLYFLFWGAYNIFFYPYYGLIFSLLGACLLLAANLVWTVQLIYYTRKKTVEEEVLFVKETSKHELISIQQGHAYIGFKDKIGNFCFVTIPLDKNFNSAPNARI